MARESGNIIQQVGVQPDFGTAAAATRKLAGLTFIIGDKVDVKTYRRKGAKFNDVYVNNKKWTEGTYEGPGSYNELCYILASLFPYTVAAVEGASGAFKWTFLPSAEGNDDAEVLTIEEGDDEAAEMYQDVTLQSLDLGFTRDDVNCSGNFFAKPKDDVFSALSEDAAQLASRPMSGNEVDVYMDSTFAGIGTTKLTDVFEARFAMGNKRDPKWVLNSANKSWKESKEIIPDGTLMISTEHNSQSRALRAALEAAKFFRVQSIGPLITGSTYYRFRLDFCGKILNPDRQPDLDGIYGFNYEFGSFLENTMGRGYSFEIINQLEEL